ncbi:class I SAM-dependent methyltransferase [Nocardioides carbamazepini]|uniref:class I SAM-dependent methyltransferase n=1 Tax=Nocardioides carbamazepini TaxID=2854259 RepID=UPI00214A3A5A|nr:class I SAM-dependent methyltransferase [Nocardioides carbamazepini]MCR1783706.1 class I SAM-dependent methyltransferase [Nocardioides carbamazepini]
MTTLLHRSSPLLTASRRHRLARVTRWRHGLRDVPVAKLLLGGQNGMTATEFAAAMEDPLWPSRRVADGPHAGLIALAAREGGLTDAQLLATPYARMARTCIRRTGRYFGADDAAGVVAQARAFLAAGDAVVDVDAEDDAEVGTPSPGDLHSPPGQPVLVVPIAHSDCYQVLDGHHRVAQAAAVGAVTVPVRVRRGEVTTPLQDLLGRMSWLDGGRQLYQPVGSPELAAHWPTVRCCVDRFEAMDALLRRIVGPTLSGSYLDVASCYGWFVAEMGGLGFEAEGMERDPLGATLGRLVYGLDPARIRTGDAVRLLRGTRETWDVVSCFSLLHHFVLGRGSCDEVELVRLLDRATGRVLFLDTGQEHERWFRSSLRGWDPDHIRAFLREHTTFDQILDLGPDRDAVGPYADNYGRHLFACVRTAPAA